MSTCEELGIPNRLRKKEQDKLFAFERGELLFRWFEPNAQIDFEGKIGTSAVKGAFKPPHEISTNRSSLCKYSTDVLYNHKNLPHRFNFGVVQTKVDSIKEYEFSATDNLGNDRFQVQIKFDVDHVPENCMYPHTNITVYRNGELIENDIRSKSLKADIRDELRLMFSVCHYPNPDFNPEEIEQS